MVRTLTKQEGSTHVVITILLMVALIGALGWIFWQNFVQPKSADNNSAVVQNQTSDEGQQAETKYLEIPEWGVKFPYASDDTLSYRFTRDAKDNPAALELISKKLGDDYEGCKLYGGGMISRGTANQTVQPNPGTYGDKGTKVGDYYYIFIHGQANCADTGKDNLSKADLDKAWNRQLELNEFTVAIVPKVSVLK